MAAAIAAEEIHQEGVEGSRVWLKKLKLHKYWPIFSKWSYSEFMTLNENNIDRMIAAANSGPMTHGAKKKLLRSIEALNKREEELERLVKSYIRKEITIQEVLPYLELVVNTPIPTDPESSIAKTIVNAVVILRSDVEKNPNPAWVHARITGLLYNISKTSVLGKTLELIRKNVDDSGFFTDDSRPDVLLSISLNESMKSYKRSLAHSTPVKIRSMPMNNDSWIEVFNSKEIISPIAIPVITSNAGDSSLLLVSSNVSLSSFGESHSFDNSNDSFSDHLKNYNYLMEEKAIPAIKQNVPSGTIPAHRLPNKGSKKSIIPESSQQKKSYHSKFSKQKKTKDYTKSDTNNLWPMGITLWPTASQNAFLQGSTLPMGYIKKKNITLEYVTDEDNDDSPSYSARLSNMDLGWFPNAEIKDDLLLNAAEELAIKMAEHVIR